jgi:hypothetical protein
MAFLVLGLSCLACADDIFAADDGKAKTELVKQGQKEDSHDDDYCSPFCNCTCCAGFSFNHFLTEIDAVSPCHDTQYASHNIASVIEISLPIWQPPQLV